MQALNVGRLLATAYQCKNVRNFRTNCEIHFKLTTNTPDRPHSRRYAILLTLHRFQTLL